jgi:hypothetical protein
MRLQIALDELGLPCYHMVECFKHPGHPEQWMRAADGEKQAKSCTCSPTFQPSAVSATSADPQENNMLPEALWLKICVSPLQGILHCSDQILFVSGMQPCAAHACHTVTEQSSLASTYMQHSRHTLCSGSA